MILHVGIAFSTLQKITKLRSNAGTTFDFFLATNGVEVRCLHEVPVDAPVDAPARARSARFVYGQPRLYDERVLLQDNRRHVHSNHGQMANYVGVDPGVRSGLAFLSLTDPALKMPLRQNQWQQESGMRDVAKMRRSLNCPSQAVLTERHRKSVSFPF
jgi:hypothetical protein